MREVLERRIQLWLEDPESTVEYAEEVDKRWAVRMRQEARDATTVWFDVGERSLRYEAYFIPKSPGSAEVHRQALVRNMGSWRAFFAVDAEEAIVLRGRLHRSEVTLDVLDLVLGEIYEMVEVGFKAMIRAGFESREKSV